MAYRAELAHDIKLCEFNVNLRIMNNEYLFSGEKASVSDFPDEAQFQFSEDFRTENVIERDGLPPCQTATVKKRGNAPRT